MIERTTVRLPSALLDRARRKAAAEGRTLTSLIEEGLHAVTKGAKPTRPEDRKLPRISTAEGGFYPGIDISNNAAIQDLEDLEYIERLNRGFK